MRLKVSDSQPTLSDSCSNSLRIIRIHSNVDAATQTNTAGAKLRVQLSPNYHNVTLPTNNSNSVTDMHNEKRTRPYVLIVKLRVISCSPLHSSFYYLPDKCPGKNKHVVFNSCIISIVSSSARKVAGGLNIYGSHSRKCLHHQQRFYFNNSCPTECTDILQVYYNISVSLP